MGKTKLDLRIATAEGSAQAEEYKRKKAEKGMAAAQARNRDLEKVFRQLDDLLRDSMVHAALDGVSWEECTLPAATVDRILEGAK